MSSFFVFPKSLSETEIMELASRCTPSAANEALYDIDDLAVSGGTSFIVPSKCKCKQFRTLIMIVLLVSHICIVLLIQISR